jgi:predicted nucleotidyltransferase
MSTNGNQQYEVEQARERIVTLLAEWRRERPIRLCVLFGSHATGKSHAQSDVDLAVWPVAPPDSATKLAWLVELQNLLEREVSLVLVSPDLDPVLGFEIVRDGRLLFEREPDFWLKERARLWHAYNDSLPFRRAARAQLRQFAEEIRRGA